MSARAEEIARALEMTGCANLEDLIDKANVGASLLERIDLLRKGTTAFSHWMPADDPAEIVFDLVNYYEDRLALPPEGGEEKDEGRDMSGETFLGMRVAAWREEGRCGGKYGHVYSEHWSTPGAGAKNVERLFNEHQIQSTLAARNARIVNLVGAIDDFAAALAAQAAEIAALKADKARMGEALTPSADTKAAYSGEFKIGVTYITEDEDEVYSSILVPWDQIKEIMAAILARSALKEPS